MTTTTDDGKIICQVCNAKTHAIVTHLRNNHPEISEQEYIARYPAAPLLSPLALQKIEEKNNQGKTQKAQINTLELKTVAEAFGIDPSIDGMKNWRGDLIKVSVISGEKHELVPDIEDEYVYEVETLRNLIMAIDLNEPLMVWGHTGTGKTTILEQLFARTNRPCLRVQHTANTEERDIVGQYLAKDGATYFNPGPLVLAMRNGWAYLADEYDFAMPQVTSVYQSVLEGKPLVIKEAEVQDRIVRPHPNFRFVATGNTNGTGDETFLYSGTVVQNSANYDRFGVVIEKHYMSPELEIAMLVKKTGIEVKDARKIIDFGTRIRDSYKDSTISAPISPRTLIRVANIGMAKGNFMAAVELTYANKLTRIDKEVALGLAQRIFS